MLYSLYKEIAAPTNINNAITCHLISQKKLNLVCIKGNVLSIYRLYKHFMEGQPYPTARLELINDFTLEGVITSICAIRLNVAQGKNGLDCLLLSFKDAKMSLVEYNVENQTLVTISMHNYEKEELRNKTTMYKNNCKVVADPLSRCACLQFYNSYFAILPFTQENNNDDIPYSPSFVIQETEIDEQIRNVIDFKFLYGFLEPTIAILYETHQTFAGRLAQRKDTCSMIVVSLDLYQKQYPVLYRVDGLPYNSTHIEAVPNPVGGVVIFSHNAVIHVDQTHTPGLAVVVNPFFDMESHFKSIPSDDGTLLPPVKNKPQSIYVRYGKTVDSKALGISLDGCRSAFLSPDIFLMVLRNGDCYRVDLVGDEGGGNSWKRKRGGVKSILIKKMGLNISPPSTMLSLLDMNLLMKPQVLGSVFEMEGLKYYSNFLFVGSVVTDALLIQFMEPVEQAKEIEDEIVEDPAWDDDMDMELYGNTNTKQKKSKTLIHTAEIKMRMCDSMFVAGPIRNVAIGQPAPYSDEKYCGEPKNTHLEIVGCGGFGDHGSLVVLHRSIRPQIFSSFDLGDIEDLWEISSTENEAGKSFQKYLILGLRDGAKILKTGESIEEVENTDFVTEKPSVSIGACCNNSIIVQVCYNLIVLLDINATKLSKTSVGSKEVWIESCSIADPFVSAVLNTGEVLHYKVSHKNFLESLGSLKMEEKIVSISLFEDNSFHQQFPTISELQATETKLPVSMSKPVYSKTSDLMDEDDDLDLYGDTVQKEGQATIDLDDDLYGKAPEDEVEFVLASVQESDIPNVDVDENLERSAPVQFWCFCVTESGEFLIYSHPNMKEQFRFTGLQAGHRFLNDGKGVRYQQGQNLDFAVEEISVVSLGADYHRSNTYLIVRNGKFDLLIYRVVRTLDYSLGNDNSRLAVQFVRIDHSYISRGIQSYMDIGGDKTNPETEEREQRTIKRRFLKKFDQIGVSSQQLYSGVVLTGPRPCWLLMAKSGGRDCANFVVAEGFENSVLPSAPINSSNTIRVHPMNVDGPIAAFSAMNIPSIPNGFAYVNKEGLFRLAQLPIHFGFDNEWPICKVPLGRTAKETAYHPESQTYVLASSKSAVFQVDKARYNAAVAAGVITHGSELSIEEKRVSGIQDVIIDREPGLYLPEVDNCELELVSPVTWETVDRIAMNETEQIITVKSVNLASTENTSGRKTYIAVGTGYMRSEELACRGRVFIFNQLLLYEIIDVVPEPGNPQTNHKLKKTFASEEKQPISAVCAVNGYLLAAVGTKIYMYECTNGDLNGVAFLDVNVFVVNLSAIKNFVLISDMYRSVWFVAFQEQPPKLFFLGKDLYPVQVVGSEFIVGDTGLGMLVSDINSNLHVMAYEPYSVQAQGGERLLRRGEINLGHDVQSYASLRLPPTLIDGEYVPSKKSGVIAGTLDGGLSMVLPVSEKMYKRLYGLYSRMVTHMEHYAGLNPRGYRQIKLPSKSIYADSVLMGPPGPRGILDGSLLYRYLKLSSLYQHELAEASGSEQNRVIDDLLELSLILDYF